MNRWQRRDLERRLRKIGDQELPSGRVVTAKELFVVTSVLWATQGEEAVDKLIAAVEHGAPSVMVSVEDLIGKALLAGEKMGLIAPTPLGESGS